MAAVVIRVSPEAQAAAWRRALEDCGLSPEQIDQLSRVQLRRLLERIRAQNP